MTHDVSANDVVAFFVEIGALVILGIAAWHIAPNQIWARLLTTVAIIGSAIALWALFASPQATFDVPILALAVKILVLGGSVVAAYLLAGHVAWPTIWAGVVIVNTVLLYVGPFARQPHQ